MPLAAEYTLRPYREGDASHIAAIMQSAILTIGPRAYSAEQVEAWTARAFTVERVTERVALGHQITVTVDAPDIPVAYALLERDGHLDHLYCDPNHTRRGLAEALLANAEKDARALGCQRLYTEASELARPVFERAGYRVTKRRDFTITHEGREVPIHNFAMEKTLD